LVTVHQEVERQKEHDDDDDEEMTLRKWDSLSISLIHKERERGDK